MLDARAHLDTENTLKLLIKFYFFVTYITNCLCYFFRNIHQLNQTIIGYELGFNKVRGLHYKL